jgi:hypothetical protein
MAAEGEHMTDEQVHPPRIAQMLVSVTLPSADAESVVGDLLEEYRAVRRPSLGPLKADIWYWRHALSVVGHLVWPFALALVAARLALAVFMAFPLSSGWNPSLLPAPNLSLLDALFFLAAGYFGARRTGRVTTGVVSALALGLIDFAVFAAVATLLFPTLPAAVWSKPFILLIGLTFLALAVGFACVLGTAGALVGGRTARSSAR